MGRQNLSVDEASLVPSETITAQIVEQLRTDILSGELAPGSKLKIGDLCFRYGTGSSPVREGLSLLVSDGLVERLHQRGFRVKPASLADFIELLKTREWLEERALRESISHGDVHWEESVVLAHHRLCREPRWLNGSARISNPQWERHHKTFHLRLVQASGSSIMSRYCEQLYDQNIRYRQLAVAGTPKHRLVSSEHAALCAAAVQRDADRAVELLLGHYRETGRILSAQLEDMEQSDRH
ncbi:MAG: GntR family transcriptional regulator [Burkholderiaceae bacterium]